jgi:hypothetical protein
MRFIRGLLQWLAKRRSRKLPLKKEKVYLSAIDAPVAPPDTIMDEGMVGLDQPKLKPEEDIDFSRIDDLESYTENLNVPTRDIEAWISAGLLYPDEIRTAERMIQILRRKEDPSKALQR